MLRLAGTGFVVLVAGAAVALILLAGKHHSARPGARLSTKVASAQTVGLLTGGTTGSQDGTGTGPQLLVASRGGLAFIAVDPGTRPAGYPEWTADQMVGGSYVFIYISTGRCLGAAPQPAAAGAGPGRGPALALQRCDLSARQRWGRQYRRSDAGQQLWQLRNAATGRCLAAGAPPGGGTSAPALLQQCAAAAPPAGQLIAFSSGF